MALGQAQYFYTVELSALEEHVTHSMERVARMRDKALRRNDVKAADEIGQLQQVIDAVQHRIALLK
jgi:hypothetical protein